MVMMGYKQPSAAEQLCDKTVWRTVIDTITCWVGMELVALQYDVLLGVLNWSKVKVHYYIIILQ